jgi:hypothetical protein
LETNCEMQLENLELCFEFEIGRSAGIFIIAFC